MNLTTALLWMIVLVLGGIAYLHPQKLHRQGLQIAWNHFVNIFPRIVLALLVSGFLSVLIPADLVAVWLGKESGIKGILIASLLGGITPGGPVISYPIAVILFKTGAGVPALIAFLTAWSVLAFHRMFAFEIPLVGLRFATVRILSSIVFPPLAGILASLVETHLPIVG